MKIRDLPRWFPFLLLVAGIFTWLVFRQMKAIQGLTKAAGQSDASRRLPDNSGGFV